MNYYIDFDNTLYETSRLTDAMLDAIANEICNVKGFSFDEIKLELKNNFNREHIYNIYKLAKFFGDKYDLDSKLIIDKVDSVIASGRQFVYNDVEDFLRSIKNVENKINILTYVAQEDLEYQLSKLRGSGLLKYFDNVIVTSTKKSLLDLVYEEGIFIDDNPKDLLGLYERHPKELIRVRRETNKYSNEDLELSGLKEVKSLRELM